jgi:hypothetical protein
MKISKILKVLKQLEWSDHVYDPAHDHSYSCPVCGGCSTDGDLKTVNSSYGHTDNCKLDKAIKTLKKLK